MFARLGGHDRGRIAELLDVVGLRERGGDRYEHYSLGDLQRDRPAPKGASAVLDVADQRAHGWTLIGALMVMLHEHETGAPTRPATADADAVVELGARPV